MKKGVGGGTFIFPPSSTVMCVARESWLEDGEEEEKLLPLSDPALWGLGVPQLGKIGSGSCWLVPSGTVRFY